MTTINGSTPSITTNQTSTKHPVRNTLIGAGTGVLAGAGILKLQNPSDEYVASGVNAYKEKIAKEMDEAASAFENNLNEKLPDMEGRADYIKENVARFKENTNKSMEELEKTLPKFKENIINTFKSENFAKKGPKYAAIGALIVGAVALAGTFLFGDKKVEKTEKA